MLPDSEKCKKVIAWSDDYGMDQNISWCLPAAELNLETICSKYGNFTSWRPVKCEQGLTCLQAFARAVDQQMSGTMLYKLKQVLLSINKKLQISCTVISFGFS